MLEPLSLFETLDEGTKVCALSAATIGSSEVYFVFAAEVLLPLALPFVLLRLLPLLFLPMPARFVP